MIIKPSTRFFSGLNELRAIAAILVVIHHIELFKSRDGHPSLCNTPVGIFINNIGKSGVYLFFVLSGFLITYLLIKEIDKTKSINIKNFYIRRILKIWPLYYLLLIVCFVVFPIIILNFPNAWSGFYVDRVKDLKTDFWGKFICFLFFLPNIALFLYTPIAGFAQSWSVGVEEQFYVFWPWIVAKFKNNLIIVLTIIIILKFSILYALPYLNTFIPIPYYKVIELVLIDFKIELMALGGIGAVIHHKHDHLLRFFVIYKKYFTLFICMLGIIIIATNIHYFLFGIISLLLIILAIDKRSNVFINKQLNSLGTISYGIYMYHPLIMFFSMSIIYKLNLLQTHLIFGNILAYTLTFGGTILVSYFSYQYFEKKFLAFKEKYTS